MEVVTMIEVTKPTSDPRYSVGDRVKSTSWGGGSDTGEILEIKWIYHNRDHVWRWGYRIRWDNKGPGWAAEFIPEVYLSFEK